jgi:hypothetical protein
MEQVAAGHYHIGGPQGYHHQDHKYDLQHDLLVHLCDILWLELLKPMVFIVVEPV